MRQITSIIGLALLTSMTAFAAAPVVVKEPPAKFFRAGEFNLDLYGTASISNADRDPHNVRFGTGVGATYWVTRGLGFGARGETDNAGHSFVDRGILRAMVRAPLWDRVAPYGYVDGAFDFERDRWNAGAGGGVEYRFFKNLGAFAEAGLNVDTEGAGRMRGSAGLRLSF